MCFSEQLKKYRRASNLSQEDLAEKLGISRQTISKWESEQSVPDVYTCLKLCKIFDITPNQLLLDDQTEINVKNNENAYTQINRHRYFALFNIVIFICGTVLLIVNLYNGRFFEPIIHVLSLVMMVGSGISFICISIVRALKNRRK